MRSEREMYDLIMNIASSDKRIRAVYMNGSRTNPNVIKDKYRDFDVVYAVTETQSFLADESFISQFGDIAIKQEPDLMDEILGMKQDFTRSYTWLMLFKDGNRIDLKIIATQYALEDYLSDTLCVKLLDKDNLLPNIPKPSDSLYHIKPPTEPQYDACCNEFWWCLNNVAKGIVRKQMIYAQRMYMEIVHSQLEKMMEWYIGMQHEYQISTGMWGKYFEKYLTKEVYEQYESTYSGCNYEELWNAVFVACDLFRKVAKDVSDNFGYSYNEKDDEGITDYLHKMRYNLL